MDCGYRGMGARVRRDIERLGRDPGALRRVVLTHAHPDHAGSASELAGPGTAILAHPADAAGLTRTWRDLLATPSRGALFAALTPEPPAIEPVEDGAILPVLGGLRVVHTPGHTPGSICLYGARDRVLFVGDTLQARFGRISFASSLYSDDHAEARRSVKRLAALDVDTIVFSHFPPLVEGATEALDRLARAGD